MSTDKLQRAAFWFLVISYSIGSPAFGIIEAQTGLLSERFGYPSTFLYLVSATQFVCALLLFNRRAELWSIAILTILAAGAVVSHFRIGSPLTSLPALAYVGIQIWYGLKILRQDLAR